MDAWVGLVGAIVGYAAKLISDLPTAHWSGERENAIRREEATRRRDDLQRTTLLELQEEIARYGRFAGASATIARWLPEQAVSGARSWRYLTLTGLAFGDEPPTPELIKRGTWNHITEADKHTDTLLDLMRADLGFAPLSRPPATGPSKEAAAGKQPQE